MKKNIKFSYVILVMVIAISFINAFNPTNIYAYRSVEEAISWAYSKDGSQYWNWKCFAFVREAYDEAPSYESAIDAWNSTVGILGPQEFGPAPRGALVFYDSTIWGHVGIALGDGKFIHAHWDYGVREDNANVLSTRLGWRWPIKWTSDLPGGVIPKSIEVEIFCVRFDAVTWGKENDEYYVEAYIIDTDHIIESANMSGDYISATVQFTYNLYSRHPGWWWTNPNVFISEGAEPNFPLNYTVNINFKDGTMQYVSKSVNGWEWAE